MNILSKAAAHKLALPLTLVAMTVVFSLIALSIGSLAKQNQTYDRYNSCVLSVPAHERDQDYIEICWKLVQEDTGTTVKRYDKEDEWRKH